MPLKAHSLFDGIRYLFSKRLTLSLFAILPVVFALTAFASGFIALILVEHFLVSDPAALAAPSPGTVREVMRVIRAEVLGFTLLGTLAGFGVAYAVVHPLRKLVRGASRAVSGDPAIMAGLDSLGELEPVGQDFQRVLTSMQEDLIDSLAWGWILFSKDGTIAAVNPGAEVIFGVQARDFIGRPCGDLFQSLQMESDVIEGIHQTLQGQPGPPRQQLNIVTPDQRQVTLSFSTTLLRDSNDGTLGAAATFKDLTRSQEISERMHRTDKLAAMGTLAACLAHEIRNPLGAIRGLAQLLGEGLAPGDARRSYTDTMIREIDRLDEVVTNLREFTQTSPDKAGPCRINDLVEQALLLARVEGDADRPILEKRLDPNLPLVQGEGRKLVQALLNLMLNATQAVEPAGSIRVSTTRVAPGAGVNGRVRVSVANSGPLPDPSVQARMFDPFFTTKKDGTGLGLAIASQIAHAHQGRLFSVHRDGLMTFCLDLPVSPAPDPALPQS